MLPSYLKYVSIKTSEQCLHIPKKQNWSNGLKGIKKRKRENHYSNISQFFTMFKGKTMLSTEV